jgi:hypothetical protein
MELYPAKTPTKPAGRRLARLSSGLFFSFDELIRNPIRNRFGQRFHENRKFDELIELDVRQGRDVYVAAIYISCVDCCIH